jgi:hypothetical protein
MAHSLFFFDDWPLARRDNLVRRLGQPLWNQAATYTDPTVEMPFSYPTVLYDEEMERWRIFYLGRETLPPPPYRRTEWLLTAESADGLQWQRPDLTERVPLPARVRPHEVFDARRFATGGSIYYDPLGGERRFCWPFLAKHMTESETPRVARIAYSADGYHWQIDPEATWHPGAPDPGFFTYRIGTDGPIVTLARPKLGDRRIARTQTQDWQTWSQPEVVLHPDALDPALSEFYGIAVLPYKGVYVGIVWVFLTDPQELAAQKLRGRVYGELVYSYDGYSFLRSLRQPFVPLNGPGEDGGGCIYPSSIVQDASGTIRIYSGATKGDHFQARTLSRTVPNYATILLHTLREDGFVYLEAEAGTGLLTTRWVQMDEQGFTLNVAAPYGQVRVQITDPTGAPLPDYTFDRCEPFTGDATAWRPRWQGDPSLAALAGRPLRIEVELFLARIFAINGSFDLLYVEDLRRIGAI